MKGRKTAGFFALLPAALLSVALAHRAPAQTQEKTSNFLGNASDSFGFSPERLERLHEAMQREVDQKELPGVVTVLARHGKLVESELTARKTSRAALP